MDEREKSRRSTITILQSRMREAETAQGIQMIVKMIDEQEKLIKAEADAYLHVTEAPSAR